MRGRLFSFFLVAALSASAQAAPKVLLAPYSGIITPVASEFMTGAIARAEEGKYDALLIELDTPGGLMESMRDIIKGIFASEVPVIVYVSPEGSRAASAGVFITMAAHVAVMAPGTNIGAAHPVAIGSPGGGVKGPGEKKEPDSGQKKILEDKAVNDAAAYIRSIARKRNRNEEWAAAAVTVSTSIPAGDAVSLGVVDFIAKDTDDLFAKLEGRKLDGLESGLSLSGATIDRYEMTRRQRWLAAISDPNVAMILMSLGAGGLFIEMYNPGLILPGVVGVVCLLLAFYSFQTLSASYAGVLLIAVGMIFLLLEIKVTSYGLLALGGIAATLLGVLMLFQESLGGLGVSWTVILTSLGGLALLVFGVSALVMRAYGRKVETGEEGLIGKEGEALTRLDPEGDVRVLGEIWKAEAAGKPVKKGETVVVVSVDGMRLKVRGG
jgi:membrane-bound serine protease (ClpP class)